MFNKHGKWTLKKVFQDTFFGARVPQCSYQRGSRRLFWQQPPTSFIQWKNSIRHANSVQRSNQVVVVCSPGFLGTTETSQNLEAARRSQGRSMVILSQAHIWRAMPQVRDSSIATNSLDVFTWVASWMGLISTKHMYIGLRLSIQEEQAKELRICAANLCGFRDRSKFFPHPSRLHIEIKLKHGIWHQMNTSKSCLPYVHPLALKTPRS